MAYQWIMEQDDLNLDHNNSKEGGKLMIQRYILATLYFATGGGRTLSTWKQCSAVPYQPIVTGDDDGDDDETDTTTIVQNNDDEAIDTTIDLSLIHI